MKIPFWNPGAIKMKKEIKFPNEDQIYPNKHHLLYSSTKMQKSTSDLYYKFLKNNEQLNLLTKKLNYNLKIEDYCFFFSIADGSAY